MTSSRYRLVYLFLLVQSIPYWVLLLQSLGSGWSFPRVFPDRLDGQAWMEFGSSQGSMVDAIICSAILGVTVGTISTALGLAMSRQSFFQKHPTVQWFVFLPFALSPVLVGSTFLDLYSRLGLSGTYLGVILAQTFSALSFSILFFSQMWTERMNRLELLVTSLGGNRWQVWRHAILPHAKGLIIVCWMQTALYAWLDYGYASVLGGGNLRTLTVAMFSYIREGSVNYASQACLLLLSPSLVAASVSILVLRSIQKWRAQ